MPLLFLLLAALLLPQASTLRAGPSIPVITEANARSHATSHPEPTYPPIAMAARVAGDVILRITISPSGEVTATHVLSGPAMLQGAAIEAIKHWSFQPFLLNGSPSAITTTITLSFHLAGNGETKAQSQAAQDWFPLSDACRKSLRGDDPPAAVTACKAALDKALEQGNINSSDLLALKDSYQLYGHALLLVNRAADALDAENSALETAKKTLKETDEEMSDPYAWRAIAEARGGQFSAALADYTHAEEIVRAAMANLPDMKQRYSLILSGDLRLHAQLLQALGEDGKAAPLLAEAKSLAESAAK